MESEKTLDIHSKPQDEYGPNYDVHILEVYKLYVEMADRIGARRQAANSFFLSINTAIFTLTGYIQLANNQRGKEFFLSISFAGIILCYQWFRLVRSYKGLISGKFKVIHEIEKCLPLRPYDMEWKVLGMGKRPDLYIPCTNVEIFCIINIWPYTCICYIFCSFGTV
ncbi:hypothetical protein HRE53_32875 (plasmid) [Acaryochloris sp. 'Moss Beach']|uniref:RipA family octameric membrane protein n=1 Tax=Acaryochloris sp. 'Moss Beach' TaxID=2740837 RepID=UPI001F305555|nr:hypothetical protein [Acaryochloris sp. 'Moss Beach']UJB73426.1 hypothetical protein HRE53_32875 [Acaryochloris sp. 'Moss Beach']